MNDFWSTQVPPIKLYSSDVKDHDELWKEIDRAEQNKPFKYLYSVCVFYVLQSRKTLTLL